MASTHPAHRRSDDELRAIYDDRYVEAYDPHAIPRMRRMLPYFQLSGREVVADFGCGNGALLEVIGPSVREYVGVDFSDAFVAAAERRRQALAFSHASFQCGDIATFCANHAARFDAGFALDFSEHIYDEQFVAIFRAIHGALKPGGVVYLHTPNLEYFMEQARARGVLRQIEGHVAVRGPGHYRTLLAQSGFADVDVRYLPHYLYPASAFHWLGSLPAVGRYFRARLFLTARKVRG